jgi:hypothetical protein
MSKYVDLTNGMVADLIPVTPSDTVDIEGFVVGLYVTTGGDVAFETQGGTRTLTVPDNYTITCLIKRVNATGTTATGLHAFII